MKQVLEEELHIMLGHTLLLQPWKEGNTYQKKDQNLLPTWCILNKIPHEAWTREGIGRMASIIGKPICVDSQTADMERMSYARICVMVPKGEEVTKEIEIDIEDGVSATIQVEAQKRYWAAPRGAPKQAHRTQKQTYGAQNRAQNRNATGRKPTGRPFHTYKQVVQRDEARKEITKDPSSSKPSSSNGAALSKEVARQGDDGGNWHQVKGPNGWRRRYQKHQRAGHATMGGEDAIVIQPTSNMAIVSFPPQGVEGNTPKAHTPIIDVISNVASKVSTQMGPKSTPQSGAND